MQSELTVEKIPELLAELEKSKLIICYSNSSTNYIQVAKWWDYQSGMRRIFPSHYPPPHGWQDRIKGVSVGQTPTNGDVVRPKPEPESGTRISKPEPEVVGTPTTAATATATEAERGLLSFLETLEGWRFEEPDDLQWLRDFTGDFGEFSLPIAKACRDYHSGRVLPKHKGSWKARFRHWMEHERPQKESERRSKDGQKGHRASVHSRGDFREPWLGGKQ